MDYYEYSTYFNYEWNYSRHEGECKFGVLTSNSLDNIYIEGNNHVCYPTVEILNGENGENGKEKHTYNVIFGTKDKYQVSPDESYFLQYTINGTNYEIK